MDPCTIEAAAALKTQADRIAELRAAMRDRRAVLRAVHELIRTGGGPAVSAITCEDNRRAARAELPKAQRDYDNAYGAWQQATDAQGRLATMIEAHPEIGTALAGGQ